MTTPKCPRCGGGGWLCEDHPDRPSPHEGCGAMGVPCPDCNADDPPRLPDGWVAPAESFDD
jgi:hypothetical protein